MTVLRARGLWAAPPGAPDPVVRGISLEVGRGEWVALHGPNGGGKTTLALVLAGLWGPSRGTVEFEGRALVPGQPAGGREGIAAILQDPAIQLLQSTVADELALAPRNLGVDASRVAREVERIAAALDLSRDLARDPRTLSAGRQQSVLLGASLTAGPRLLVADEPGAHLDPGARRRSLALVADEVARGMAVVWVTQDPLERRSAHREVLMGGDVPVVAAQARRLGLPLQTDEGPPVLIIEVSSRADLDGPRVATDVPISIPLARRGVTTLEGPNGSGKSVVLAAVAGALDVPQVVPRWRTPPAAPAVLATQYPEQEAFEEHVLDEVTWAATQRGMSREAAIHEARALLGRLGCPADLADRRLWGLSGGEKRLIQLAGALLTPAGVVLLDEPTAGLDSARREALATEVLRRSESSPVLTASQDTDWLDLVAGRRVRLGG